MEGSREADISYFEHHSIFLEWLRKTSELLIHDSLSPNPVLLGSVMIAPQRAHSHRHFFSFNLLKPRPSYERTGLSCIERLGHYQSHSTGLFKKDGAKVKLIYS
jgi:hypothetical protein